MGILVTVVVTISGAPALLSEFLVDVLLAAMLHRRLQGAALHHWLGTALARTWWLVVTVAVLMSLIGWCLATLAPGAVSIGPAIRHLRSH